MDPTLDGVYCFGIACHCEHIPDPPALQIGGYFGQNGLTSLNGGLRGRRFRIEGVLVGTDLPTTIAAEALLLGFGDGYGHAFIDTQGRTWSNMLLIGYHPSPEGPKSTDQGWCLPYECELRGLT